MRLLVRDDTRQVAAAEEFVANGAWVSLLTLAEAVWVLSTLYKMTPKQLADFIEMSLESRNLALQDAEAVAVALELFRLRPALGFSDCLILKLAQKAGHLPLGTFNRDLAKMQGAQKL